MRRDAVPGATGTPATPAPRPRVEQPAKTPRGGNRGRKARAERRTLEAAVSEIHDIRNERNPLARRHLGPEAHIDPAELPGKDRTRAHRAGTVLLDVDAAYRVKRGER